MPLRRWGALLLVALSFLAGTVKGNVQIIHRPNEDGGIGPVVEAVTKNVFTNIKTSITDDFTEVALLVDAGSSKFAMQVYGKLKTDSMWVQTPTDDADYKGMFKKHACNKCSAAVWFKKGAKPGPKDITHRPSCKDGNVTQLEENNTKFDSPLGELSASQIISLFEKTFNFKKPKLHSIVQKDDLKGKTIVCFLTGSHRNTWLKYGKQIVQNMDGVAKEFGCTFQIMVPTNKEEGQLELSSLNGIVASGINEDFTNEVRVRQLACGACAGLGGQSVQMTFQNGVVSREGDGGLGRNGMSDANCKDRGALEKRIEETWTPHIQKNVESISPDRQFVSFISGFINMLEKSFKVGMKFKAEELPELNLFVNKRFITKDDLYKVLDREIKKVTNPESWLNSGGRVGKMKCLLLFAATVNLLPSGMLVWLQREFVHTTKKEYLLKAGIVSGALLMAVTQEPGQERVQEGRLAAAPADDEKAAPPSPETNIFSNFSKASAQITPQIRRFRAGDYIKAVNKSGFCRFENGWIGKIKAAYYTVDWKVKTDLTETSSSTSKRIDVKFLGGLPLRPEEIPSNIIDDQTQKAAGTMIVSGARRRMGEQIITEFPRRRRMAQREFSDNRDSPVMIRLLKEIAQANQRAKHRN